MNNFLDNLSNFEKVVISLLSAFLLQIYSTPFLAVVFILMIMDFLTGVIKTWVLHKLDSTLGQKGCVKVLVYLVLIISANYISQITGFGAPTDLVISSIDNFVMVMISFTEFQSIIENMLVIDKKMNLNLKFLNLLSKFSRINTDKINQYIEKFGSEDKDNK